MSARGKQVCAWLSVCVCVRMCVCVYGCPSCPLLLRCRRTRALLKEEVADFVHDFVFDTEAKRCAAIRVHRLQIDTVTLQQTRNH